MGSRRVSGHHPKGPPPGVVTVRRNEGADGAWSRCATDQPCPGLLVRASFALSASEQEEEHEEHDEQDDTARCSVYVSGRDEERVAAHDDPPCQQHNPLPARLPTRTGQNQTNANRGALTCGDLDPGLPSCVSRDAVTLQNRRSARHVTATCHQRRELRHVGADVIPRSRFPRLAPLE